MDEIVVFNNPLFGEIRTAGTDEAPLFCATDVARALGYSRPADAISSHCKGVVVLPTPTAGGVQNAKYIKEHDVYRLIFKSSAPNAEVFNTWFAEEVLPSIRRHGAYMTTATLEKVMNDPDSWIKLLTTLKEERQLRKQEEEQRKIAESKAALLEEVTKEQAPKVVFADAVIGSESSCLIGELAKIITQNGIRIGQQRLFEWMRQNHYLGSYGNYYNIPCQRYVEQGLFELKKSTHSERGVLKSSVTPYVTGKGQSYFVNIFLKHKQPMLQFSSAQS